MKLEENYSSSAIIKLIKIRYGLNLLGLKKVIGVTQKRLNILLKGSDNLNDREGKKIEFIFNELKGRFYYDKQNASMW